MVRIRLKRMGRKHRPFYRINAVEKRTPRDGRVLETLGWYNPMETDDEKRFSVDGERVKHWINSGAQPSETCKDLFAKAGLIDAEKRKAEHAARVDRIRKAKGEAALKSARAQQAEAATAEAGASGEGGESSEGE